MIREWRYGRDGRTKRNFSLLLLAFLLFIALIIVVSQTRKRRGYAIGEPVPLSALHPHPRHGDPYRPPALVNLIAEDARRRKRSAVEPFYPRSVTWDVELPRTSLAFPRVLLNDVSRFRVVLNNSTPIAMYCDAPGTEFLQQHIASHYEVIPMEKLALRDRERVLTLPSVFRFVLAVHPFLRLISIYREGIKHDLDSAEYRKFMASVRGIELRAGEREVEKISLRFFVSFLARNQLRGSFASVTHACQLDELNYHLTGRLEDVNIVNERLGLSPTTIGFPSAGDILNDMRLRGKVARMYSNDMQRFHFDVTRA